MTEMSSTISTFAVFSDGSVSEAPDSVSDTERVGELERASALAEALEELPAREAEEERSESVFWIELCRALPENVMTRT